MFVHRSLTVTQAAPKAKAMQRAKENEERARRETLFLGNLRGVQNLDAWNFLGFLDFCDFELLGQSFTNGFFHFHAPIEVRIRDAEEWKFSQ